MDGITPRKSSSRLKSGAMTALAAMLVATGAAAQDANPMRVGVIDTAVGQIEGDRTGVTVENATFVAQGQTPGSWRTENGRQHGTVVATSFVEQARRIDARRPIEIYSAVAFVQMPGDHDDMGNRPMAMNYAAADRALEWFGSKGVKVVVAAFYGSDGPQMRRFMDKATSMGMVVFAGTNNLESPIMPFPARHPQAVSVTGTSADLDFRFNRSMDGWVMFKTEDRMPGPKPRRLVLERGSSYAVGRAAAFGSYAFAVNPTTDRNAIVEAMRQAGAKGGHDPVTDMSSAAASSRFRSLAAVEEDRGATQVAAMMATRGQGR